jgi:hypothetical protein
MAVVVAAAANAVRVTMAVAERRQRWRVTSFYSLRNILNINKEKDLTFFFGGNGGGGKAAAVACEIFLQSK